MSNKVQVKHWVCGENPNSVQSSDAKDNSENPFVLQASRTPTLRDAWPVVRWSEALVHPQGSSAGGTGVLSVLQAVHAEGDQAAAQDTAAEEEASTEQVGEQPRCVVHFRQDHLLTARTEQLHRPVRGGRCGNHNHLCVGHPAETWSVVV